MNRKGEIKRISLTSEVRNASMVKNKCEELKLEKKRRSLDKLRAYEKLDFMNKKRELIDLQLSIQSSKTDDSRQGINHQITSARLLKEDKEALSQKMFTKSLSGSHTVPATDQENEQLYRRPRRPLSHSNSLSSLTGSRYPTFRRSSMGKTRTAEALENTRDASQAKEATAPCQQTISRLLPPFYLQPLHKQKSKSLKDLSLFKKEPKLSVIKECSSYDLSNCRYLRRWKNTWTS